MPAKRVKIGTFLSKMLSRFCLPHSSNFSERLLQEANKWDPSWISIAVERPWVQPDSLASKVWDRVSKALRQWPGLVGRRLYLQVSFWLRFLIKTDRHNMSSAADRSSSSQMANSTSSSRLSNTDRFQALQMPFQESVLVSSFRILSIWSITNLQEWAR